MEGDGQTWVDDAVPAGRSVAVLWDRRSAVSAPDPGYFPLMVTAALNDSVGRFLAAWATTPSTRNGCRPGASAWAATAPLPIRRDDPSGRGSSSSRAP